jgi:enterochelin esterase family protein
VLRTSISGIIWAPDGHEPDEPLPLLIAHDGPEYARYSSLTRLLEVAVHQRRLPPMRAALLQPVDRNETYSASARYSRALTYDVIPALSRVAPSPGSRASRIGMGASLGALAMLHAYRHSPALFSALFLQSGSFFRQRFDKQEAAFARFGRITRFVGRVLSAEQWPFPIPVTITCGSAEENLFNNRAVTEALVAQGHDVTLVEHRDAHNWVSWRDTFDPHLIDLLAKVWG